MNKLTESWTDHNNKVTPKRFTDKRDDIFMNSLVGKQAREVKDDGKPTGC